MPIFMDESARKEILLNWRNKWTTWWYHIFLLFKGHIPWPHSGIGVEVHNKSIHLFINEFNICVGFLSEQEFEGHVTHIISHDIVSDKIRLTYYYSRDAYVFFSSFPISKTFAQFHKFFRIQSFPCFCCVTQKKKTCGKLRDGYRIGCMQRIPFSFLIDIANDGYNNNNEGKGTNQKARALLPDIPHFQHQCPLPLDGMPIKPSSFTYTFTQTFMQLAWQFVFTK